MSNGSTSRGEWGSKLGFILAAAGSAVGLGNIWKFPYITGHHGGGLFVIIYLICIALVGLPIMIGEVIVGRATQSSPVGAFKTIPGAAPVWQLVGWMGVLTGFIILSYYSVVAGWSMHYTWLSISGAFSGASPDQIASTFGGVVSSTGINLGWHVAFMVITVGIVVGGVSKGIENAAKILMPALMVLMLILFVDALFQKGFGQAFTFLFKPSPEKLSAAGVLEALGHSFFTLSLGMGAMLTYGSYLSKNTDVVSSSALVSIMDTGVALLACLILFPIIFTFGMAPEAGPGLVFKSIPIALSQMTGGRLLATLFFVLLFFAALSSGISLLEVVAATLIDQMKVKRSTAAIAMGAVITLFGVPSALSNVPGSIFGAGWMGGLFEKNFFDSFDWLASNVLLPLGGLLVAIFVGWAMPEQVRREEFSRGSRFASQYPFWLLFVRFVAPAGIIVLFLYSAGILKMIGLV